MNIKYSLAALATVFVLNFDAVAQKTKTTIKAKPEPQAVPAKKPEAPAQPLTSAEKMPAFPGGDEAMENYFVQALDKVPIKQPGGVTLSLVTDKTGKVTKVEMKSGYRKYENGIWLEYPEIDKAILEAALKMPAWEPGLNQGKPVAVQQDVHFTLMTPEQAKADSEKIYSSVGQHPQFPGGEAKMMEYIKANLKYPEDMKAHKLEGMIVVQFIVTRFGAIKDITIIKPLAESMNAETIRMIREMPRWTPGKQNGIAVNVRYTLPVRFNL